MIRQIVRYPNQVLAKPAAKVGEITGQIRGLVADMEETLYASTGVGLAAPQVGESLAIFVLLPEVAGRPKSAPAAVFINPELLLEGTETEVIQEGCLSFPGVFIPSRRPTFVALKAMDLEGREFSVQANGLFAVAALHETEHLMGKTLFDRASPLTRQKIKNQSRGWK